MKQVKHLLFLGILCSIVLFNSCGDSDDPVVDTSANTTDDTTIDDSDTALDQIMTVLPTQMIPVGHS